jgi:uncharacterized protein YggE
MDENESEQRVSQRRHASQAPPWSIALFSAVLLTGVAFGAFALGQSGTAGAARGGPGVAKTATVTVSGTGTVQGKPDTVSFEVGVQTTAATATAALADNNSRMRALEAALSSHGVAPAEMQTSNLSINDNTNSNGVITGFSAYDDLNVTMHDIAKAGQALQAAANSAGNDVQLNGITFSISNQSQLLAAARAKAMRNARVEAAQLAAGAGASLGEVLKVTTTNNYQPIYQNTFAAVASPSVPLSTGRQPVSVNVQVTYRLG